MLTNPITPTSLQGNVFTLPENASEVSFEDASAGRGADEQGCTVTRVLPDGTEPISQPVGTIWTHQEVGTSFVSSCASHATFVREDLLNTYTQRMP